MLRSMTGFGKSAAPAGGRNFSVEIRSLNSKYLDLNLKLPAFFREKELEIRNLLSEKLIRGKVELSIEIQSGKEGLYSLNQSAIKKYYEELAALGKKLGVAPGNLLDAVMKIPDVLIASDGKVSDAEIQKAEKLLEKAVQALDDFRCKEGRQLGLDLLKRVNNIRKAAAEIEKLESGRKELIKERLRQKLSELTVSKEADAGRLEQELLFYAEKLDITEELVRLKTHCNYFSEVADDREISKGKKLGFITQEMGREINTLGAKANDALIQKRVVEMKDELEKIKEQVNNVL